MIENNRITDEYILCRTERITLQFKDGDKIHLKYVNRMKEDMHCKVSKIIIEICSVSPNLYQKFLSSKRVTAIEAEQKILDMSTNKEQEQLVTMRHDCNMKIDRIRDAIEKNEHGSEQKYLEITLVGKVLN